MITMTRGAYNEQRNNMFLIQWQLGNFCNYNCSYCQPGFKDGSRPWIPIDLAKKVVDNLLNKLPTRHLLIDYQGGEVTVYPEFLELLKYVYDRGGANLIVSNASRSVAYLSSIAPYLHTIYLTYHHEQTKKLDQFIEKVKVFHPKRTIVYVPMHTKFWDECVAAYNKCTELGYRAVPKCLYHDFGGAGANVLFYYTPAQKRFIDDANANLLVPENPTDGRTVYLPMLKRKTPVSDIEPRVIELFHDDGSVQQTTAQNLMITGENVFTGYECYGGLEMLCINALGNVRTSVCSQDPNIANIYENPNFDLPTAPMICKKNYCWCEADLQVTKILKK